MAEYSGETMCEVPYRNKIYGHLYTKEEELETKIDKLETRILDLEKQCYRERMRNFQQQYYSNYVSPTFMNIAPPDLSSRFANLHWR